MKPLLLALCLTSPLAAAHAEQTTPTTALAQKSSFAGKDLRNPFWPIGWAKPKPGNSEGTQSAPLLSPDVFALTSVTTGGGDRFAILNGKIVQEGGQFGLLLGSQTYQVTVQSIQDGEVILAYQGGQVVVPLRRH
ncbi:MAG: hypothetical protein ABI233_06010 [Chthoniobacterales bacterium]